MANTLSYEKYLPDHEELDDEREADTSLHAMSGPPIQTPRWVIDSWRQAIERRRLSEEPDTD